MQNLSDESRFFYTLKGYAIISVVLAHTAVLNAKSTKLDQFLLPFLVNLGLLGVPVFFLGSGYFYSGCKRTIRQLASNKLQRVVVPWFFCGTVVYFTSTVFGSRIDKYSVGAHLGFVLGNGSLYYYMTVLFVFYILFYFIIDKIEYFVLFAIAINLVSIWSVNLVHNPYLNPLNFIAFFSIGIMCRKYDLLAYSAKWGKHCIVIALSFFTILVYITLQAPYGEEGFSYFKISSFILEVYGIIMLCIFSTFSNRVSACVADLGRMSFSIYLLHMPVAGAINMIFSSLGIAFIPFKCVLVLLVVYLFLKELMLIINKYNLKWLEVLIGIR